LLNNKDTEIHNEYDSMAVEELEQQLKEAFFYTDQIDEPLEEELHLICNALDEKKPLKDMDTVEEYWTRFTEYYAADMFTIGIQDKPATQTVVPITRQNQVTKARKSHYRAVLRRATIAAVVVAILVGVACVSAAFGYNLWGWIPIWNDEELQFISETQEPTIVSTISAALQQFGIDEPLYPTWLPEEFVLTESQINARPLILHEAYHSKDRYITITISSIDGFGATTFQKEDNPPMEYIAGEKIHYLFNNSEEIVAVWYTEEYTTLITGTIQIDEMEKIINSVYEVR